jgi:exo-beta-1,3-glucanase (GH17 family)
MAKAESKGLCLDDTTFQDCSSKIPEQWPQTDEALTSLRLFKAWGVDWPLEKRAAAWDDLVAHVKRNNVKVLMGTQVTCSEEEDDADWEGVQELLQRLGADHVMGLAVGNEMELCKNNFNASCCQKIWFPSAEYPRGYYYELFAKRAEQLGAMSGFSETKLTAAFGAAVLGGPGSPDAPFMETADCGGTQGDGVLCAKVSSFVRNALDAFRDRFVFTVNIYAFLDDNTRLDSDNVHCTEQLKTSLCYADQDCYMSTLVGVLRQRMSHARGDDAGLVWVGETGWSSPKPDTLSSAVANCEEWSSKASFQRSYENFAAWDLDIAGIKGPDHVFYFTMRDSTNFGQTESFGLIETCASTACKISAAPSSASTTPASSTTFGPGGDSCCADPVNPMDCCGSAAGCCPLDAVQPMDCCTSSTPTPSEVLPAREFLAAI